MFVTPTTLLSDGCPPFSLSVFFNFGYSKPFARLSIVYYVSSFKLAVTETKLMLQSENEIFMLLVGHHFSLLLHSTLFIAMF